MRLLIYEWCCSGGLTGPDAAAVAGDGPEPFLTPEGWAMFRALVADAVRDGGFDVVAVVGESLRLDVPPGVRCVAVSPGCEIEALVAAAREADATIVVAPETAGVLAARVEAVRTAGGVALAPSVEFIRVAADKQATIDALAAAGVPVPAGRSLAAGEPWPRGFRLPAVRKARSSAGCDGLVVVRPGDSLPCPASGETRLEVWSPGRAVGVSCLLGPRGVVPVAAVAQRFSADREAAFIGGDLLEDPQLRQRAERLATRAVGGLLRGGRVAAHAGWVGVDMILGVRHDGLDDRVLEVNPRVTTSFVGLAAEAPASLVRAMVDAAAGRPVDRIRLPTRCRFSLTDDIPRLRP